ncbi:phosphoribosylanthranilate isomerase [Psychrobacillus insolitus]|uniref:N-(5'-phosphoribosyl)anthranilate isomerase n=1 Tax=Psychrobacillus insolitus TaxID=1461 RepID=A0A2W7MJS5_9BACI|nr:phosphoribosylanthranilate isomerase [Psychrobacillus insolitus]PZX07532.1 phosphoribosylanthranilate isomerase [Psychrobacillus insolitus]
MTKVKICGLKEKEHVKAAVEAGADAIGFVFAASKREVSIEQARELAKEVPPGVLKIGVFVNPTMQEIETAVREVPLDFVQYHGNETPEFIQSNSFPSIKALSVRSEEDIDVAKQFNTDFYLFDAPGTDYQGGSGLTFNWQLMQGHSIPQEKIILAGGLNPTNVEDAIKRVNPYMVDVSSGVEVEGRKDSELIRAFIRAVK